MTIPEYDICDCGVRGPHEECKNKMTPRQNTSLYNTLYVNLHITYL